MSDTKPYAICSDVHCHDWSRFSRTDEDGVNSRLRIILNELLACAAELRSNGGDTMVIAGDLFHVRGSVKPSVMNPVFETFQKIQQMGVFVTAIAGNHDLEGKDADSLGNAMHSLGALNGFTPVVKFHTSDTVQDGGYPDGDRIFYWPWFSDLDILRKEMAARAKKAVELGWDLSRIDAVIHAPLNGVIKGIPEAGLTPEELSGLGYNRVFVGHFHNHKSFEDGKVYSVGATTHQTWGDPGSRAGFCLVWPDRVKFYKSGAPEFVDIKTAGDIDEAIIKGNYVRLKIDNVTEAEIIQYRNELEEMGAIGVNIIATKKAAIATRHTSVEAGASLEKSVQDWIKGNPKILASDRDEIAEAAASIIVEARSR